MKVRPLPYIAAAIFFMSAALLLASELKSVIISHGTSHTFNLSGDHAVRIVNFTQEGGTSRGVVAVTTDSGNANVLTAAILDPSASPSPAPALEVINTVVIAGPAAISVTCPADATGCFVSYRKADR